MTLLLRRVIPAETARCRSCCAEAEASACAHPLTPLTPRMMTPVLTLPSG